VGYISSQSPFNSHLDRRDRRRQHDPSKILQILIRLLRNKILALDIHRKDAINIITGHFAQSTKMFNTRVAHDDIQTAEFALNNLKHGAYFGLVGDVGFHCDDADAVGADFVCDGVGAGERGDVVDGYVCSTLGELEGDCCADAAAGARYWGGDSI
jgi:hypothetical protein